MRLPALVLPALVVMAVASGAARAQTLEEIDRREAAVIEAWNATALSVRKAFFVAQHPDGFGQYVERAGNVFKPGEKLVTYAEPVGYGWKDAGDGIFEFGLLVDFAVRSPTGEVLAGKEDFARLVERSHARNREFMVVLTLDVHDAPPGAYVLRYTLRDITGPKTVAFDLPFKIAR